MHLVHREQRVLHPSRRGCARCWRCQGRVEHLEIRVHDRSDRLGLLGVEGDKRGTAGVRKQDSGVYEDRHGWERATTPVESYAEHGHPSRIMIMSGRAPAVRKNMSATGGAPSAQLFHRSVARAPGAMSASVGACTLAMCS
jgi:hypothetical protein